MKPRHWGQSHYVSLPPPSRSVRSTHQSHSVSHHPPSRSVRLTHQSHSASPPLRHGQCDQLTNHILPVLPSVTVSVINSPITFCQSSPPSRSVRSTHQSHSASPPLRHDQCDQLTDHILSVSPTVTISAINSPITFCQSPPPPRSVRSTHQSHSASLPLRHDQCDQLTNHILSVITLRHGQCDQLTNHILSVITLRHGQCD